MISNRLGLRKTVSVTVVIPCYDCSLTLGRALESVIEQTMLPEQVILVDDASTDATREVIHTFQELYGDTWLKLMAFEQNYGPAHARNEGIKKAESHYIAFLDADDSWHPRKLEIQYSWMQSHPDVALTGHRILLSSNAEINELRPAKVRATKITSRKALLSNPFSTPTVMMKSALPYRFEPGLHRAEDYLLWLEICLNNENVYRLETPLAFIHKAPYGEAGLSQNLLAMEKGELKAYINVYESNAINVFQYYGLVVFSILKFVRRTLLSILAKKTS